MPESPHARYRREGKLTTQKLVKLSESLADLDWRLLYWLLRYPLQRADDLLVGVARWASRAAVYRHVQALQASGLVESVVPKTPGAGKRLYHLSNFGLHMLAWHLGRPARKLAREWLVEEAGLLRLLPRLPTLLVLQNVVNGLVTHAAEALTTEGRRPRLVRWTWQRNVTHGFSYREQRMRLFVDGVAALCIRTQQSAGAPLDTWYGLFLLFTELDDERLMRLRLERLLCWRESPERWPVYQHMLLVLILARSPRQREHWQHAVETSALKLRLDPPTGALACLPAQEGGGVNPWLLPWRTLSTDIGCHLQHLLTSLPPTAFPPSLHVVEGRDEELNARSDANTFPPAMSTGTSFRLKRLVEGDLAERAARITGDRLEEPEAVALLGLRLTSRQWEILRLLLAHPLLSDEELAAFLNLPRSSARCALYDLHHLGCLESVATEVGKRWHLRERGLRLMTAANHWHICNLAVESGERADGETPGVMQRGEAWLLRTIQHTAGMYGFFASLAQAAAQEAGHALCWWETGAMCERRYRVGEKWHNLRPDALAEYCVGSQRVRFWLEWDRGTMNARDLEIKFASYAHYLDSREWAREWSRLPLLVCVAPDIAQERRILRAAQARCTQPPALVLWTTTGELLKGHGPLAPIWLPGSSRQSQTLQMRDSRRHRLFDAIAGKEKLLLV